MSDPDAASQGAIHLAAIDIGTNSIRLVIARATPDGEYRVLDDEKEITRLGKGLAEHNRLDTDAMHRSVEAIARMKEIALGYNVAQLRAIATCAVREAQNGPEFVDLVAERAGLMLEVISAEHEARLAYRSAAHAFDLSAATAAIVDIGGGSTEVVIASQGVIEQIATLRLGAVRLTEQFAGVAEPEHEKAFRAMWRAIRRHLKEHLGRPASPPQFIVGTGGTFTTLAAISSLRGKGDAPIGALLPFAVKGYEMQRSEVRHQLDHLRKLSIRARARVPGLPPDRAEIIVAGIAIADRVMNHMGVNTLRVLDRGIRDGLILEMIDDHFPRLEARASQSSDRWAAVRRFASKCRYEGEHSNHVADLALQIFDQLGRQRPGLFTQDGADPLRARDLLKAAAILHDVGYFVNYAKHHKHSYHLIVHSDLAGFPQHDLELIANIARYHRRAAPKRKHAHFAALEEADRTLVRRLAAILRIAVGLDRTHTQAIERIYLVVTDTDAVFTLEARAEPEVDIWGAQQKSRLFAREYDLRPEFRWLSDEQSGGVLEGSDQTGDTKPLVVPAPITAPDDRA